MCPECKARVQEREKAATQRTVPKSETIAVTKPPPKPPPPVVSLFPQEFAIGGFPDQKIAKQALGLLLPGETIEGVVWGRVYEKSEHPDGRVSHWQTASSKCGLFHTHFLIATDRRVILWARGLWEQSNDAFAYREIRSVELQVNWSVAAIVINVGRLECFGGVKKSSAERMVAHIRERIANSHNPNPSASAVDLASQLEKLSSLRTSGVLSDEEFQAAKRKLLG
jgi:hypothetical protein